jgi:hypothetical protein
MVLVQRLLDNMRNYIQSIKTLINLFVAKKETKLEEEIEEVSEQQIEATN